ncbi:MAG: hypothetical protein ACREV4_13360 [Gammaproteobacteria bacterium]
MASDRYKLLRRMLVYAGVTLPLLLGTWKPVVAADRAEADPAKRMYRLDYVFTIDPGKDERDVWVRIKVSTNAKLLRSVELRFDAKRFRDFKADGDLEMGHGRLLWRPPKGGGELAYRVSLNHQRGSGSYDALLTPQWALFRGDDLVPPTTVRALKEAESRAYLTFQLPEQWTAAVPYKRFASGRYRVVQAGRKFDRPLGWMVVGKLGVRLETMADRKVTVAGAIGSGVSRQDMLAFLNWNLPHLIDIFPRFTKRLLIVSAGDPMWRGGLFGPRSLYIHANQALISENGTSVLLHELVHVAMRIRAVPPDDWIVEGLAEFYALKVMRRSGTITKNRYAIAHQALSDWGKDVASLRQPRASGAVTAKAVSVFRALDSEIRKRTKGRHDLDDVARALASDRGKPVSLEKLREIAERIAGSPLETLALDAVKASLFGDQADRKRQLAGG